MVTSPRRSGGSPSERIELVTHEKMVNWLGPGQLLQTGLRAAVASTFGSFADARQLQAALHPAAGNPPIDASGRDAVWVDVVADTGDGWNSTYSVAYSVGRASLDVPGVAAAMPRADLLILGGDQVYPTPAQSGYRTRFLDPFRSAFPATIPVDDRPDDPVIVATPGNHDWYDGLKDFTQLFCSRQHVGRWQTVQNTSYWAVRLPHGWWLWGVDLQLASEIDPQQYAYFVERAKDLKAGDQVVLVSPEPSWIDESERLRREKEGTLREIETQTPRFRSLKRIEALLADTEARLEAVIAGDLHHYARYEPTDSTCAGTPHRITCGGGGAYLLGTHDLPQTLSFKSGQGQQEYRQHVCYPDVATSKSIRNRAWQLPGRNVVFCALLAAIYLLYAWVLQSASKVPNAHLGKVTLMEYLAGLRVAPGDAWEVLLRAVYATMAHSPSSVLLTLGVVVGASAFTKASAEEKTGRAAIGGALHGVVHLLLALLLLWGAALVNLRIVGPALGMEAATFIDHPLQVLLFTVETSVLGGLFGGLLFGTWMLVANAWFGWHGNDVFSSQGIADHKCFLRMRLDATGLTIHPLKIAAVARRWTTGAGVTLLDRRNRTSRLQAAQGSGARFEPAAPLRVELIEPPLHIPTTPRPPPSTP